MIMWRIQPMVANSKTNIYKKLADAKLRLQTSQLQKTGWNPNLRFNYFELKDFLPTLNSILNDVGLVDCVSITKEEAVLTIYDTDDPGTQIVFKVPYAVDENKRSTVQNLGASITYLRRYLYTTAFNIVENDVIDAAIIEAKPAPKQVENTAGDSLYLSRTKIRMEQAATPDELSEIKKQEYQTVQNKLNQSQREDLNHFYNECLTKFTTNALRANVAAL